MTMGTLTRAGAVFIAISGVLAALLGAAAVLVFSGLYNVAADAPHTKTMSALLSTLRERSIARYASQIKAPADLMSSERITAGARQYSEMCSQCHLGPGLEPTELSRGLYPAAPQLARKRGQHNPSEQFWIIKHGIKLTAMPAWGKTHSDDSIWNLVAFVRGLPEMSPQQYSAAVAEMGDEPNTGHGHPDRGQSDKH
jgi:mono/diheme cytochrome c family protein